jgi:hypothetical protein
MSGKSPAGPRSRWRRPARSNYCAEQLEEIANHLHRLLRQYGVSRSTTQPPGGLTNAQPPNTQSGLAYDDDIFVERLATQALKAPP